MSQKEYEISVSDDGRHVCITQTIMMPIDLFLLRAGEVYQYQTRMRGVPVDNTDPLPQLEEKKQ